MTDSHEVTAVVRRFANRLTDRRGSIAVWFSLSFPLMIMFAGAAIDYAHQTAYQRALQAATDAAAIAAASGSSGADADTLSATVNQYISNNFSAPEGYSVTTNVALNASTGAVTVKSSTTMSTMIMGMIGYSTLPVNASAAAVRGATTPTEIALVFDTTYSMSAITSNGLSRMQNAQAAAVSLINSVMTLPNGDTNPNVKVGLVPFGLYVNVSTAAEQSLIAQGMTQAQAWAALTTVATTNVDAQQYNAGAVNPLPWLTNTNTNDYTATVQMTIWGQAPPCTQIGWLSQTCTNDGVPYDCSYMEYSCPNPPNLGRVPSLQHFYYGWSGCVSTIPNNGDLTDTISSSNPAWGLLDYNCASPLQRLTSNKASLVSQINSLVPYDNTYIPEGLVWGWRVLSPNSPFSDAAAYSPRTKKILILMTDGFNTNQPNPNHEVITYTSWMGIGPNEYYNDVANDGTADATTKKVCASIQAQGITVYTITFLVDNPTIKTILLGCASEQGKYFDALDITSLRGAFNSIGNQLNVAHLIQ